MKKVTTYTENSRTFWILKDENGFWGIEDKYIDAKGNLIMRFTGLTGHLYGTMAETIQCVSRIIKRDAYMAQGMGLYEASLRACGASEMQLRLAGF